MNKLILFFLIISISFCIFNLIYADDNSLQIKQLNSATSQSNETLIIVTTTKSDYKDDNQTFLSQKKIDQIELKKRKPSSLKKLLEYTIGLDAIANDPGAVRPVIRGMYNNRILSLFDGFKVADPLIDTYHPHIFSIDESIIEEVHIIKGPNSVHYGSDAIGGVINFIPFKAKYSTSKQLYYNFDSTSILQTNPNGGKQLISAYTGLNGFNLLIQTVYENFMNVQTPQGTLENSYRHGYALNSNLNYCWSDCILDFTFYRYDKDVGVPNSFAYKSLFDDEKHNFYKMSFQKDKISDALENFQFKCSYQHHDMNEVRYEPTHIHGENTSHNLLLHLIPVSHEHAQEYYASLKAFIDLYQFNSQCDLLLDKSNILQFGVSFISEQWTSKASIIILNNTNGLWESSPTPPLLPKSFYNTLGFFISDKCTLIKSILFLNFSLRYDHSWIHSIPFEYNYNNIIVSRPELHNYYNITSGNIGLNYMFDNKKRGFLNIGNAFRVPSLIELFYYGPHHMIELRGNPDLSSEKSINMDIGTDLQFGKSIFIGLSLFSNYIYDYIKQYPTGKVGEYGLSEYRYENIDTALLYGGELETKVTYSTFAIFGGLSYVIGKNITDDTYLPYIPPLKAKYGIKGAKFIKAFGYNLNLWSEIFCITSAKQTKTSPEEKTAGFGSTSSWTKTDFRIGFDIKYLSIMGGIENVFNKSYSEPLSRITWIKEQPGRNYVLSISVKF